MTLTAALRRTRALGAGRRALLLAAGPLTVLALVLGAAPASAATGSPGWAIRSVAQPTNFAPGDTSGMDTYIVLATDAGSQPTSGTATISDALPAGMTAQSINLFWSGNSNPAQDLGPFLCHTATVSCTFPAALAPDATLEMMVNVNAPSSPGTVTNSATVSGGGAPLPASTSSQNQISSSTPPFGVNSFSIQASGFDGATDLQAGDHPYEQTTTFELNSYLRNTGKNEVPDPPADPKDVIVDLPLGFVGDPQVTPKCTLIQLANSIPGTSTPTCPVLSQVGTITLHWFGPGIARYQTFPVYNMVPEAGHPAEFGFLEQGAKVMYADVVPSPGGYRLQVTVPGIEGGNSIMGASTTFWGQPELRDGDPSSPQAFLTNPTECSQAQTATIYADSWVNPGRFNADGTPDATDPNWKTATASLPAPTGCDRLTFDPTLTVQPDTAVADSPAGVDAELSVPQSPNVPGALATSDLRNATVTLPVGASLSPGSAAGLQGCTEAEIDLGSSTPATCPNGSVIGTVQITTPLLPDPLTGQIFLGTPGCDPCTNADAADGNMLHGYIQAQGDGALIKLPGYFTLNTSTGQITAHFLDNPQMPFSDLKLQFKGGPRGVLATPDRCGIFTVNSLLDPWSAPDSGPDASSQNTFTIDSGCVSGFAPSFTAGVTDPQAGAYSPFVLSLSRSDTDQELQGLSVKLPPGMLAKLAGVPLCSDSDASAGTCPASTQVGTVETGAGPGAEPFYLSGGAYLTGPYKGAPYGLAVEVPAIAGPFNLGTVVVRQALYIDPTTAQATDVSDPFPTILDGIPLRIRSISVDLNRPDFTLGPTSCNPMSVAGTLTSTGGLSAPMSSRFQVGGCQELGFSPKLAFKLTGKGQTHSGTHPTLTATLTQPGGQANIQSAKVALPLSLALDTKNADNVCDFKVAAAVHGGTVPCPANTIVGQASAVTPLLSQPLSGPVYLVQGFRCQGGAQVSPQATCPNGQHVLHTLPSLLIPLRGQIALDLRAQSSSPNSGPDHGKLVTTFSTIPDAPVSKFTLQINGGRKGILVITGRGRTICGKAQVSNAQFGAQSGKTDAMDPTLSTPACGKPASLRAARVVGHSVRVTVRVPAAGRLVARGAGLSSQVRRPGRAGTVSVVLPAEAAKLDRTGRLTTRVTVSWTPRGGGVHTMTTRTLTIRR